MCANKEIIEYKETLISKKLKSLKNLFNKEQLDIDTMKIPNNNEEKMKKNEKKFLDDIKVKNIEKNDSYKMKVFLDEIYQNPEALKMLSIDRLKKLEKYYDSIIKQNEKKIKKMQD